MKKRIQSVLNNAGIHVTTTAGHKRQMEGVKKKHVRQMKRAQKKHVRQMEGVQKKHARQMVRAQKNSTVQEINRIFKDVLEAKGYASKHSMAQLKQDIVALIVSDFKKEGFFVEFGGTNGYDLSNTFLLEKDFHWNGILAEPSPDWYEDLIKNRSCSIDNRCVWRSTDEQLEFDKADRGELSTISQFASSDNHSKRRESSKQILVNTVSLEDLLIQHNAPKYIDFLSVDTEGSEYEILNAFDFSRYKFGLVTIEHNFTSQREKLFLLMKANGYRRLFEYASRWDDWYVPEP